MTYGHDFEFATFSHRQSETEEATPTLIVPFFTTFIRNKAYRMNGFTGNISHASVEIGRYRLSGRSEIAFIPSAPDKKSDLPQCSLSQSEEINFVTGLMQMLIIYVSLKGPV